MKTIDFYTSRHHFVITEQGVFQNGELVAKGEVSFHHLILDEAAWLVVKRGEHQPDTFLKTDRVYSLLPQNEYYCGEKCGKRQVFRVTFQVLIQGKWITCTREISAVNKRHLNDIIFRQYGSLVRINEVEPIHFADVYKLGN